MKILLVDPHPLERDQSASILALAGHDVVSVSDPTSALAVLTKQRFDVAVVEVVGPQQRAGLDLVRGACNLEGRPQPYLVVTAARPTPGDVGDAFQAGADDFLRKPVNRDELLARVEGLERSRKRSLRRLRHAKLEDVTKDPVALEAWRNIEIDICTDLSEMIGSTLVRLDGGELHEPALAFCLAQVSLSLPTDDYQIVISIAAGEATARKLGTRLLEGAAVDLAAMRDMTRELSNTAAASFKRSAALEGLTFTTGIPTDVTATTLRSPDAKATRRWTARDETGCILYGEAEIRRTSREMLPTSSLREGMVLVNDLTNGSGALLLRSGTRLTQSHLEHLKKAIGTTGLVEVSLAA